MIVLVAGGSGFIGTRLVDALADRGDLVTVVSRDPAGTKRRGRKDVSYRGWLPSLDAYDAVVNLCGAPIFGKRWNDEVKRELRASRLQSTARLVRAFFEAKDPPDVLVQGSAVGYYGDRGAEELTEKATPGDDFLARLCVEWEGGVHALPERTVILRTGVVLEPAGGALAEMLPPFRLGVGGPIGNGRQYFPWIHMADEVGLILWALDNPTVRGPVNASAPGVVTNRIYTRALGKVLRRPTLLPIPKFALRLKLGEVADMLGFSQRCVPRAAQDGGYPFKFPEIEPALRDLLGH